MTDREKMIEEMAKVMFEEYDTDICKHECPIATDCSNRLIAKKLYDAGYRKQSDTIREFVDKLKEIIHEIDYVGGYAEIGLCEEIDELAAQYGVEVE